MDGSFFCMLKITVSLNGSLAYLYRDMAVSKRQMRALREIAYDLFRPHVLTEPESEPEPEPLPEVEVAAAASEAAVLPPLSDLYRMYDEYNRKYFGGRLPATKISYSGRMLIAGSYTPSRSEIKIGRKYHEIFPEEIADTLKHEMIHVINPRHDGKFKALAFRIGASLKAKSHPALRGNYKYLYVCPACGKEYPRRKRLRMAYCGICTTGRQFDDKYKLKLVKAKKVK